MGLATNHDEKILPINRTSLLNLPKIEVHRHLEGSYPINSLHKMALKNQLDVPQDLSTFKKEFQFPKNHKPDFLLFLSKFKKFWYKSLEDVSSITYDSVKVFSQENIHFIELRFNPLHFTEMTNLDFREVTKTIMDSGDAAAKEENIQIRYLLTFNRHIQTAAEMLHTYQQLQDVDLTRVTGIDLAGDESHYPPELFTDFFDVVKKDNHFKIDIHAGEVTDSKNMWVAIDKLHADRIGHGVAAIDDLKIQQALTDRNIFLAQCITSNYQTGAWTNEATHPLHQLVQNGVPVTIASDDPTIQDSLLTDDYEKLVRHFQWTLNDLIDNNIKAIDGCFLSAQDKTKLRRTYRSAVKQFKSITKT